MTPTAAAVPAVALGRQCPPRLVIPRHQPEANGQSALTVVQIVIPETPEADPSDRASILVASAAALLDVRASQPGIGPLSVPDLRFGGQL